MPKLLYQMRAGFFDRLRSSAAVRRAAFMLEASATPLPAISNAVPWSTDVLISGNPRVTFTADPNERHFTAIVAWS